MNFPFHFISRNVTCGWVILRLTLRNYSCDVEKYHYSVLKHLIMNKSRYKISNMMNILRCRHNNKCSFIYHVDVFLIIFLEYSFILLLLLLLSILLLLMGFFLMIFCVLEDEEHVKGMIFDILTLSPFPHTKIVFCHKIKIRLQFLTPMPTMICK